MFKKFLTSFLLINLALTLFGIIAAGSAFAVIGDGTIPEEDWDIFQPEEEAAPIPESIGGSAVNPDPLLYLQYLGEKTGLPGFYINQHPEAPTDYELGPTPGVGTIGSTAYFLMDLFKYLMSGVAVIMIVVIAIKLIVAGSNEETTTKAKKGLAVAIAGLVLIQLADVMVKQVFFGDAGEVLEDPTTAEEFAGRGTEQIRGIVGFIQVALGAIAVLMIIINGIRIMVTGMDEEGRKKGLKNIGLAAGGLIIVAFSEILVRGFLFPEQGDALPSGEVGKQIFVMIINFVSGFIGVAAFLMLIYAGYTYVVAGTDDTAREKVKKIVLGAVLGLIVAMGAYAITNTLITFEEENEFVPEETTL